MSIRTQKPIAVRYDLYHASAVMDSDAVRKARDAFVMAHAESESLAKRNQELASKVNADLSTYKSQVEQIMKARNATAVPITMPVLDERGKPTEKQVTYYVRMQKKRVAPSFTAASLASVLAAPDDERAMGSRVRELLANASKVLEEHNERMGKASKKQEDASRKEANKELRNRKRVAKTDEVNANKARRLAEMEAKAAAERASDAQARRFESLLTSGAAR